MPIDVAHKLELIRRQLSELNMRAISHRDTVKGAYWLEALTVADREHEQIEAEHVVRVTGAAVTSIKEVISELGG